MKLYYESSYPLPNELAHHGIPGMKWGVRRYQNKDGSLTPAGKEAVARKADDVKREKEARSELLRMSKNEREKATKIANGFKYNKFGHYTSCFKEKIGDNDVAIELKGRKGCETHSAVSALKFIKKYDVSKAKEGIAKEFYDKKDSWIDKDPSGDDFCSRNDFKKRISLQDVTLNSNLKTYEAWWNDGGTFGYHSFTDKGSMDTMKVRRRELNG